MPKLIDWGQRREEIAEATWRIILAEGIASVSIRTVAAEAGISTGSLRHVFPSKTELLVHAMQLVDQRAWARIERHLSESDPRALVIAVITELLPLDEERRAEMEVNLALVTGAPADREIRGARDSSYLVLRSACARMITHLQEHGLAAAERDTGGMTTALHGLIDGLSMHLLINADPSFAKEAVSEIEGYIDGLKP